MADLFAGWFVDELLARTVHESHAKALVAAAALIAASLSGFPAVADAAPDGPVMGLAYQPYVSQWSASGDNPFAPGRLYTPAFNSYRGGISMTQTPPGLWTARQRVALYFDRAGHLSKIEAQGALRLEFSALREASPIDWSRTYFKFFDGTTPGIATAVDNQASVYRQLDYLVRQTDGAPLTLATYGTGFDVGYWRRLDGEDMVVLPVWAENQVDFFAADAGSPTTQRATDELYFYFPPEASYVTPVPDGVVVETTGTAGRDLALGAVHLRVFASALRGDPGAVPNPGFFLGDANAQVALAAAEINARAGKTLLTIKQGVPNIVVDGTLVHPRMRFAIRSALAQAQAANARHPGTVTHLIVSNEYAEITAPSGERMTPTRQVTEMVRFARAQMAPGGDFEGLTLAVGVRGRRFRSVDADATDPAIRQFTQDVRELIGVADVLMENIYPSPEAVEQARISGNWDVFFDPERGELTIQWRRLEAAIAGLADGKAIDIMIGEIGHPTNGIAFNLPGAAAGERAAPPGSAFARIAEHLADDDSRIGKPGIDIVQTYFNDRLSAAFLSAGFQWSREQGVQIHAFEAFDEPHKSDQNPPPPGPARRAAILSPAGSYGAEAFYGIFGYTGVAGFSATPELPIRPGAKLVDPLPARIQGETLDWAPQFSGRFYPKLPALDFGGVARAFLHTPPSVSAQNAARP